MAGLPSLSTVEGRRFWSFLVVLGACFVFTAFAAVGVWLVSRNELYTLILALAAHLQLFVGMGVFSVVLGRRMSMEAGRDGFKYKDGEHDETTSGDQR